MPVEDRAACCLCEPHCNISGRLPHRQTLWKELRPIVHQAFEEIDQSSLVRGSLDIKELEQWLNRPWPANKKIMHKTSKLQARKSRLTLMRPNNLRMSSTQRELEDMKALINREGDADRVETSAKGQFTAQKAWRFALMLEKMKVEPALRPQDESMPTLQSVVLAARAEVQEPMRNTLSLPPMASQRKMRDSAVVLREVMEATALPGRFRQVDHWDVPAVEPPLPPLPHHCRRTQSRSRDNAPRIDPAAGLAWTGTRKPSAHDTARTHESHYMY